MDLNWQDDEAVVRAAIPDARLQGLTGSDAMRVFSEEEGALSDYRDGANWFTLAEQSWKAARRWPTVQAFERAHNPAKQPPPIAGVAAPVEQAVDAILPLPYQLAKPCEAFSDYGCGCGWCHDCGWKIGAHSKAKAPVEQEDEFEAFIEATNTDLRLRGDWTLTHNEIGLMRKSWNASRAQEGPLTMSCGHSTDALQGGGEAMYCKICKPPFGGLRITPEMAAKIAEFEGDGCVTACGGLSRAQEGQTWIVVQFRDEDRWEFQGVFGSREKAEAACRTSDYCVAGPYTTNAELPHELVIVELESPVPERVIAERKAGTQ